MTYLSIRSIFQLDKNNENEAIRFLKMCSIAVSAGR